jgi:hypothetical protein
MLGVLVWSLVLLALMGVMVGLNRLRLISTEN